MLVRSLCGFVPLALSLPLACSSSSGEDSESPAGGGNAGSGRGGSGETGSESSGGASGGSESSGGGGGSVGDGGEPGMGSGGEGAAPALPVCGEADISTGTCDNVGDLCANADRCCRCIDFPDAPSCGLLWDCARPELNTDDCLPDPPAMGEACTALNVSCHYCTGDGPELWHCGRIEVGSDEGEWYPSDGLSCNQ